MVGGTLHGTSNSPAPPPINFFTGVHRSSQDKKVGCMGRWVVGLREGCTYSWVLPTYHRHAAQVKLQPPEFVGAPLKQVMLLLCTETGVIFMAFELFPLRSIFWEFAHLGAGYHHTRYWKSIVLSSESLKKIPKTPQMPFLNNWKEGCVEFLFCAFPLLSI